MILFQFQTVRESTELLRHNRLPVAYTCESERNTCNWTACLSACSINCVLNVDHFVSLLMIWMQWLLLWKQFLDQCTIAGFTLFHQLWNLSQISFVWLIHMKKTQLNQSLFCKLDMVSVAFLWLCRSIIRGAPFLSNDVWMWSLMLCMRDHIQRKFSPTPTRTHQMFYW